MISKPTNPPNLNLALLPRIAHASKLVSQRWAHGDQEKGREGEIKREGGREREREREWEWARNERRRCAHTRACMSEHQRWMHIPRVYYNCTRGWDSNAIKPVTIAWPWTAVAHIVPFHFFHSPSICFYPLPFYPGVHCTALKIWMWTVCRIFGRLQAVPLNRGWILFTRKQRTLALTSRIWPFCFLEEPMIQNFYTAEIAYIPSGWLIALIVSLGYNLPYSRFLSIFLQVIARRYYRNKCRSSFVLLKNYYEFVLSFLLFFFINLLWKFWFFAIIVSEDPDLTSGYYLENAEYRFRNSFFNERSV